MFAALTLLRFDIAEAAPGLAYIVIKFAAYVAWCYLGVRWLSPQLRYPKAMGFAWGTLRLVLGFFFGILIWLAGSYVYARAAGLPGQSVLTYLAVYVPVRWIEWSILAILITPASVTLKAFLLGTERVSRLWRLGGIAISCVADIPLIISLGGVIPVGRFLC